VTGKRSQLGTGLIPVYIASNLFTILDIRWLIVKQKLLEVDYMFVTRRC